MLESEGGGFVDGVVVGVRGAEVLLGTSQDEGDFRSEGGARTTVNLREEDGDAVSHAEAGPDDDAYIWEQPDGVVAVLEGAQTESVVIVSRGYVGGGGRLAGD